MENKIVIHIHTDKKFVKDSYRFEKGEFKNTTIFLGNAFTDEIDIEGEIIFFTKKETSKIIEICKAAHLVVLYDLDVTKSKIALKLPKSVKIAWRFFGYELYSKKKELFLSNKTKPYITNKSENCIVRILQNIKSLFIFKTLYKNIFWKAVKRCDLMLILCIEEHQYLESIFGNLPTPIKLSNKKPVVGNVEKLVNRRNSDFQKLIVLGNNRSVYNNHLELIDKVKKFVDNESYSFSILFNYGPKSSYYYDVLNQAKNYNINVVTDFMTLSEFNKFYKSISALCINGYRQMAVANIVTAIALGVKVYLHKKNVYSEWLVNEGFKIFTVEDFEKDLKENNINLSLEDAIYNVKMLDDLSSKYNVGRFQKEVLEKLSLLK
ncbi:hypothetical protein ACXGQW_04025 [Wenyingzhuangia sp. IMCC45533]